MGRESQNDILRELFIKTAPRSLFEVIIPVGTTGTGNGRISMEEQTKRWACMVDVPGGGGSMRVPLLLHTGRPVLMIERPGGGGGHFVDRTWYSDLLIPNVHYIPVFSNMTNLKAAARRALSAEGIKIGLNAQKLAEQKLTSTAAIQYMTNILSSTH